MEKSPLLKDTIYDVIKRDIPSIEEICQMSGNEKEELEKQQQQIIELFQERITQQLGFYQSKMNIMMNEILLLEQSESNPPSFPKVDIKYQNYRISPKSYIEKKASESQLNNKIDEIKAELKKIQKLSTYKRRPAWR